MQLAVVDPETREAVGMPRVEIAVRASASPPASPPGTCSGRDSSDGRSARRGRCRAAPSSPDPARRANGPSVAQVLARQHAWPALAAAPGQEARIGEAFHDAFAVLVAGARIAEIERARHIADRAVRFVDDERRAGPATRRSAGAHIVAERAVAMHRLLDDDDPAPELRAAPVRETACSQKSRNASKSSKFSFPSSVTKNSPPVSRSSSDASARRRGKSRSASAAQLHFEVPKAVGADGSLEILWQSVVHAVLRRRDLRATARPPRPTVCRTKQLVEGRGAQQIATAAPCRARDRSRPRRSPSRSAAIIR